MVDPNAGIIAREFDAEGARRQADQLWSLAGLAEDDILPAIGPVAPQDQDKRWHELTSERQDNYADALQMMVQLGRPTIAASLVSGRYSPEAAQAVTDAVATYH